jgi:hypothetical protein
MPTNFPPPRPTTAAILIQIARQFIGAGFFAIAIGLLRARLIPAAHAMARIGKRIGFQPAVAADNSEFGARRARLGV